MFRLLIVDDEPQIVNWLYELFLNVKSIELDVYKANSGKAALEWLNRTKIDIVLADICMPGIDGMELLKRIRDKWPECRVIFLTGYNEFEYAYTAIKYDGVDYLLKVEGDAAIINAVEKAVKDIEKCHSDQNFINRAKIQLKQAVPLLQKDLLNSIVQGERYHPAYLQERFDELEIPLEAGQPMLLLAGCMDNLSKNTSPMERLEYFCAIKLAAEQCLSSMTTCVQLANENNLLFWFIQPKCLQLAQYDEKAVDFSWNSIVLFVKGTLESIQAVCRESMKITVSLVMHTEPATWDEVPGRLSVLKLLLNYSVGFGTEMILTDRNLPDIEPACNNEFHAALSELKKLSSLENYLERGQQAEFYALLSSITNYLKGVTSKNFNPALEIYYSLSVMFLTYINRWKLTEKLAFRIGLNKLTRLDEHTSWKDAVEYLFELSSAIFDVLRGEQEKSAFDAITMIRQYIKNHYSEELSLVRLSEMVFFNPSYLSRLFKQVTGENICDYVNNVRIEKAKELLEKSNMKVNEITAAIGYDTPTYFNRYFKKVINMTPQQYRESFLNR